MVENENISWLSEFQKTQSNNLQGCIYPTKQDERWKYIDVIRFSPDQYQPLGDKQLNNNYYHIPEDVSKKRIDNENSIILFFKNGSLLSINKGESFLPDNVVISTIEEASKNNSEKIQKIYAKFTHFYQSAHIHLNNSAFKNGLFIYLPKNIKLNTCIHLIHFNDAENIIYHPHHVIFLDEGAQATILSEHISTINKSYFSNHVSYINLESHAKLDYYKLQNENKQSVHLAHILCDQEQNSCFTQFNITLGSNLSRDDTMVNLNGKDSKYVTAGLYKTDSDKQVIDHHITVNHLASQTYSEMYYKGILDQSSQAVFNGRVYIAPNSKNISAIQKNDNLLLSDRAEVNTKPELEIYSDDVKCQHGATVGYLNEDAVFYMQSRGIAKDQAEKIVIKGFVNEIIERIKSDTIKPYLENSLERLI